MTCVYFYLFFNRLRKERKTNTIVQKICNVIVFYHFVLQHQATTKEKLFSRW